MEVLKYLIEITRWEESPWESYADLNANISYGLVLSPPLEEEKEYSYFEVRPKLEITNAAGHAVFVGEAKSTTRLTNNGIAPTPEILFEVVVEATRDFGKTFMERTEHNPHIHHAIPKPVFKNLQGIIEDNIRAAYPAK